MERQRVISTPNSTTNNGQRPDDADFDPQLFADTGVPPQEAPDPFDVEALRLDQGFSTSLGAKPLLLNVPVRKPAKEWFIRTCPDPDYRLVTTVVEMKEVGEIYLVAPEVRQALIGESTFSVKLLWTAITRQQKAFIWPLRLPSADGRRDDWSSSALEAAELATTKWVRIQADMSLGSYGVLYAENLPDPAWPDLPFRELLKIAFKGRFIQTLDHPIIRQLRGQE